MADINNLQESWEGHTGNEVESFLKRTISTLQTTTQSKVGYVESDGSVISFYEDETKEHFLGSVTLAGDVYSIDIAASEESTFNVVISDTTKSLTFSAETFTGKIGGSVDTPYPEPYDYTISVDNGSGRFVEKQSGVIAIGREVTVNVRPWLVTGDNKIKLFLTGQESHQSKTKIFTANLSTLYLECAFSWNKAWIENEIYVLNGIRFNGNLHKELFISLDNAIIATKEFPSGTNYITSPYSFDLTNYFPEIEDSGIHVLEIWMEGGGVRTKEFQFNVMCVKSADKGTAQLVAINNVASRVDNYVEKKLFDFALYNISTITVEQVVSDGINTITTEDTRTNIQTQTQNEWKSLVEFETDSDDATVELTITAGSNEQTITLPLSISSSFLPTDGATFYMNAVNRSNNSSDKESILNIAQNAETLEYEGEWDNFAWGTSDGWIDDGRNSSALVVNAGSVVTFPTLKLLSGATSSCSIEFKFRSNNIADYDKPVMMIAPTESNSSYSAPGIYIYPTKLTVLNSADGSDSTKVLQSVGLQEDVIHHIVIVFHHDYDFTGNNLCSIYVNGTRNIHFDYSGTATYGNSPLVIGQQSTDFYLYMMRFYNKALESSDVLKNYINTIVDNDEITRIGVRTDNNIVDDNTIDYAMAKRAGYACMVVEYDGNIPDINHQSDATCNLRMEYGDGDSRNFKVTNVRLSGQGTTSMQYYRWNLRFRVKNKVNGQYVENTWTYGDGTSESGVSQKGWFDGNNAHPKVADIVAKKNYASAMQGHKMGATGLYDELYKRILGTSSISTNARVAVYQYPVLGFQKFDDGTYQFIGLYTVGPHKGDKGTFGYNKEDDYPVLMSLEGPNHSPLGTRFLHAWHNVAYDYTSEDLQFGGQEGWDADFIANKETDSESDASDILQLFESEWKPAYEIVYYCSPYIRSLTELDTTISAINADVETFRAGTTDGLSNELLQIYDPSGYSLYSYDNQSEAYIEDTGHSLLDYLEDYLDGSATGLPESYTSASDASAPTTAEIINARKWKFRLEAGNYWSTQALLFHYCFCVLIAATDNFAKNMYPFKFTSLSNGGKWSFRQDDLDSILDTDNNGRQTKPYYVLPGDKNAGGVHIYQGGDSALCAITELAFEKEITDMMRDMVATCGTLASDLGISGANLHESLYNIFSYYFWEHSAKYFPAEAYSKDTEWSYIAPWVVNSSATYNGVEPLTQARGDAQYSEREWVIKHIAFLFSRYQIGGFTGGNSTYGSFVFTPTVQFTFDVVPAIEMYPAANVGGNGQTSSGTDIQGSRTEAGAEGHITVPATTATNVYLEGTDWLSYYGDISGLSLTDRGGGGGNPSNIEFTGKRLRKIKIGDADPSNVAFNAVSITVRDTPLLEEIDARNNTTLASEIDLTGCPRLRKALFAGSNVSELYLPIGSKLTEISLPDALQTLFLNSLPFMTDSLLSMSSDCKESIRSIYINNCPSFENPLAFLTDIWKAGGNLQFITMLIGDSICTKDDFLALYYIAQNKAFDYEDEEIHTTTREYGYVELSSANKPINKGDGIPIVEGDVFVDDYISATDWEVVAPTWPNLHISASGRIIDFTDSDVKDICVEAWGGEEGIGYPNVVGVDGELTMEQAALVTSASRFKNVASSEHLKYFTGIKTLGNEAFMGYTGEKMVLPPNVETIGTFCCGTGDSSATHTIKTIIFGDKVTSISAWLCRYQVNLEKVVFLSTTPPSLGSSPFCTDAAHYVNKTFKIYVPDASVNTYKASSYFSPIISGTGHSRKILPLSEYEES